MRTTRADEQATRHAALVDRRSLAWTPNELSVTDLTYVPTWAGVAYVCFIVDVVSSSGGEMRGTTRGSSYHSGGGRLLGRDMPTTTLDAAAEAARALFHRPRAASDFVAGNPAEAAAAVRSLAREFADLPGTVTDALEGAAIGAELLSHDPLQGLSEIVQNADDVGARTVRFRLSRGALIVAHDGAAAGLRDVLALATPWLTTKRENANSTGRFGIGLMTLRALSPTLEFHSGNYHVRIGSPTIEAIAHPDLPNGFAGATDTVLRVPLPSSTILTRARLRDWGEQWDEASLLFCRSVSTVIVTSGQVQRELNLTWKAGPANSADAQRHNTRIAAAADGRRWLVRTVDVASPSSERRASKAQASTTPLGVALALGFADEGCIYAGLPLRSMAHPVRMNAQFDPIANRQGLAATKWNRALVPLASDLWAEAVLDVFLSEPANAWRLVPSSDHQASSGDPVVDAVEAALTHAAARVVAPRIVFKVEREEASLRDVAVESRALERLIVPEDIAALAGLRHTLPANVRDADDKWRCVIADWRNICDWIPDEVSVSAALGLFDSRRLDPVLAMGLVMAAVDEGLDPELDGLACIPLADHSFVQLPGRNEPWVLLERRNRLAHSLGVARLLHPLVSSDDPIALRFREWLGERGATSPEVDSGFILGALARAGNAGHRMDAPLSDAQLSELRRAFEALDQESRETLGRGVGKAILIRAFTHVPRRGEIEISAPPSELYQPRAIDKEPDSFAVAAGAAPNLKWASPNYARVLKSPRGRSGLGAQKFLRLLGVESTPRLVPHRLLHERYPSDHRLGLAAHLTDNVPSREARMRALGARWTLSDIDSPDLTSVLEHISAERRATTRRRRAAAMIATLGKAWDRIDEQREVVAANDSYGWQTRGTVAAFWVFRASAIRWIDDQSATPSAPSSLRLRTAATLAVHGPSADGYIHRDLQSARPDILAVLGVAGEPVASELLDRLEELRLGTEVDALIETPTIYGALSERVSGGTRNEQISREVLRRRFAAGDGLVLTSKGWSRPDQILRGPPLFGSRRAFAPQVPRTDRLWTTLEVREPGIRDALAVLAEIAATGNGPTADDEAVVLESMRLLERELAERDAPTRAIARTLNSLALWTSQEWCSSRPIYAVDDLVVADSLGEKLPVWRPGGDLDQFQHLIGHLGLQRIDTRTADVPQAETASDDEDATELLRAIVPVLREDLARNDPATSLSLTVSWDLLEQFEVRRQPDLSIRLTGVASPKHATVRVVAFASAGAGVVYLDDEAEVARLDGGGWAVANLFNTNRRRVGQAWLAAAEHAAAGHQARRLQLAEQRADEERAAAAAAAEERLRNVQRHALKGQKPVSKHRPRPRGAASTTAAGPAGDPRVLVNPYDVTITNPDGTITTGEPKPARTRGPQKRGLPAPNSRTTAPQGRKGYRAYTDLEKETVGMELLRRALSSNDEKMLDLRAQQGLGADALDVELNHFFELKVSAGPEPDRIVLERSEYERALADPSFCIAVISGVEAGGPPGRVRIIANPIHTLRLSETSKVILSGVSSATTSLVYNFESDDQPNS